MRRHNTLKNKNRKIIFNRDKGEFIESVNTNIPVIEVKEQPVANNNSQKLVSICIPVYEMNGFGIEYLKHSLKLIHEQTYKNIEVIISDHSVNNDIENFCKGASIVLDIKYFKNKIKIGSSSANINNALSHASGDIIKILFQDDYFFYDGAVEDIVNLTNNNPEWKWIVTACAHDFDGKIGKYFYPEYNDKIHYGINTISSPSVLSIRNKELLFDENLIWLMDVEFYKQLYDAYGAPLILNKINIVNRMCESQVSKHVEESLKLSEEEYVKLKYDSHAKSTN